MSQTINRALRSAILSLAAVVIALGLVSTASADTTTGTSTDTIAPTLSNISVWSITSTSAIVNSSTNESAITKVYYTTVSTSPFSTSTAQSVGSGVFGTMSATPLMNLTPNTKYYIHIEAKDAAGNTTIAEERSFTTLAGAGTSTGTTTPPTGGTGTGTTTPGTGTTTTPTPGTGGTPTGTTTIPGGAMPVIPPVGIEGTGTTIGNFALVCFRVADYSVSAPWIDVVFGNHMSDRHTERCFRIGLNINEAPVSTTPTIPSGSATSTGTGTGTTTNSTTTPVGVISSVSVSGVSANSATVNVVTNVLSTRKVYYSTTHPVSTSTAFSAENTLSGTNNTVILNGLLPNTTYYYVVEARDGEGRTTVSTGLFATAGSSGVATNTSTTGTTTATTTTTTGGVSSGIASSTATTTTTGSTTTASTTAPSVIALALSEVGSSTAMLHLSLSMPATVKVYYATTSPISTSSASALVVGSDTLSAIHSIQFTRLSKDTIYYYVIETRDAAGNTKVSLEQSFTSDAPPDQPPPGTGTNTTTGSVVGTPTTPLAISSLGVTDMGPSSALIIVSTNQPATTRVHYSDVSPVSLSGGFVTGSSAVGSNATIVLTGLAANTTYYYVVESTDAFGHGVISGEQSFKTTTVPPLTNPPVPPGTPPPPPPPTTPPPGVLPATTIIPTGGPDVTPPVISQVSVTQINTTNAVVRASTDEVAMVRVFYSTVSPVPVATAQWANLDTFANLHAINLVGLRAGTTYYYVIEARDAVGNVALTGQGFFTTASNVTSFVTANAVPGTTGGPVAGPIETGSTGSSVIATIQVTGVGPTSAIVNSSTPRPSITKIYYSSNPNSLRFARDVATTNIVGTSNATTLTNLAPNTTYYFVVDVQDIAGISGASSQKSFTTLPLGSPTPPGTGTGTTTVTPGIINTGPNEIVGAFVGGLDRDSAIITWPTNHPATSKVYYGFTTPLVLSTAIARENTSLVTNHVIDLPSLTPNTAYYYVVESKDEAGNITRSATLSFTTMPNPPATVLGVLVMSITSTSAVVNVSASGPVTTTKVFYASNPSLLSFTGPSATNNNVAGANSTIQLSNLTPNTTYYYTVEVRDAVGASSASSMRSFTTAP